MQAWQDKARELVIPRAGEGGIPIRYKIDETWYEMTPIPSHIRSEVITELGRMLRLPDGQFPKEGVITMDCGNIHMIWRLQVRDADADCIFTRLEG